MLMLISKICEGSNAMAILIKSGSVVYVKGREICLKFGKLLYFRFLIPRKKGCYKLDRYVYESAVRMPVLVSFER